MGLVGRVARERTGRSSMFAQVHFTNALPTPKAPFVILWNALLALQNARSKYLLPSIINLEFCNTTNLNTKMNLNLFEKCLDWF